MAIKSEKLSADRIIKNCDHFREYLWPIWMRERQMVGYYNGKLLPSMDSEETSDNSPVSLGLGNRYIKKPFDQLMDTILVKPGFIRSELKYPLQAQRKSLVERKVDHILNTVTNERMQSVIRGLAGRALITGRAFAFRLSRWDWVFRTGRLLHDIDATDDILSEDFREWAFMGRITLREIDGYLEKTRDYEGSGWNYNSLRALKKYIIRNTTEEKDMTESKLQERCDMPFGEDSASKPMDVYWFFRKNGEKNLLGQDKVDLYCVSRFGTMADVKTHTNEGYNYLSVKTDAEEQEILYFVPNAFDSIQECLIPCLLDSRVDGEQELAQIDGTGKTMIPRLMAMEHLTNASLEGIAFGIQPNWTSQQGTSVDEQAIKKLQKNGVGPWDYLPPGLTVMNKNNALTGFSSALTMLQNLGLSADQDAATGEVTPGSKGLELKDLAQQFIAQSSAAVSRRAGRFHSAIDKMAENITETLLRPLQYWTEGDPGYHDARRVQTHLLMIDKVMPPEISPERITAKSRRLSSDTDAQTAVQAAVMFRDAFGGQISPAGHRFLAVEAGRAIFGDPVTEMMIPEEPNIDQRQVSLALAQNSMAIVSLLPPTRQPEDDPQVHMMIHLPAISQNVKVAQQAGSWTIQQRTGVGMLLEHCAQDVPGLPAAQQQEIGQAIEQIARVIASIPVAGQMSETQLKEQDAQRKMQELQLKYQKEQNVVMDRERKAEMKQQQIMLQMTQFLEQQKSNGVVRASQLLDMMQSANEPMVSEPTAKRSEIPQPTA